MTRFFLNKKRTTNNWGRLASFCVILRHDLDGYYPFLIFVECGEIGTRGQSSSVLKCKECEAMPRRTINWIQKRKIVECGCVSTPTDDVPLANSWDLYDEIFLCQIHRRLHLSSSGIPHCAIKGCEPFECYGSFALMMQWQYPRWFLTTGIPAPRRKRGG